MDTRNFSKPRLFCLAALAMWLSATFSFAQQQQDPFVGTWISTGNGTTQVTLVLNADGTGMMNTTQIRWSDQQGFNITVGGNTVSYSAQLNNDTMIISGGDLQQPLTFQRQGGAAQPAQPPSALGGALGGGGTPQGGSQPQAQGDPNHPSTMFGAWVLQTSDGNLFLVLNPDGSGQLGNSPLRWAVQSGQLVLAFNNGKQNSFPLTVYGDTMQLSATSDQGQPMQLVFHRTQMQSNDSQQQPQQPQQQPQPQQNSGYNDTAALVGQWTSSNGKATVIFYPNGTTHFGSDTLFGYSAINGTLTIWNQTNPSDKTTIAYRLDGDTLYMVIDNQNLTFARSGPAGQAPGATGQPDANPNPLGAAPTNGGAQQPAAPQIDPAVVGTWQATDGTTVTFNADGTFVWNGQQMRFTTAGNVITIQGPNGSMQWQYQANGATMQVTFQGTTDTLHRVNAPAPAQPTSPVPQNSNGW